MPDASTGGSLRGLSPLGWTRPPGDCTGTYPRPGRGPTNGPDFSATPADHHRPRQPDLEPERARRRAEMEPPVSEARRMIAPRNPAYAAASVKHDGATYCSC